LVLYIPLDSAKTSRDRAGRNLALGATSSPSAASGPATFADTFADTFDAGLGVLLSAITTQAGHDVDGKDHPSALRDASARNDGPTFRERGTHCRRLPRSVAALASTLRMTTSKPLTCDSSFVHQCSATFREVFRVGHSRYDVASNGISQEIWRRCYGSPVTAVPAAVLVTWKRLALSTSTHLFATRLHTVYVGMRWMNADEYVDDDPRRRSRAPFTPSEAWIDAFDHQCTDSTLKTLRRYAAWLAGVFGHQEHESLDHGEDLLQNALLDITSGVLRWDPDKQDLMPYLADVLRLRTRRDHKRDEKRHNRYEHVSLDVTDPDDLSSTAAEVEASLAVGPLVLDTANKSPNDDAMKRRMSELRLLTADDPLAQRFLRAFDNDHDKSPADIMSEASLTSAEYYSTRRRLARLYAQLEQGRGHSAKAG
jgi:hypothetical protein